MSSIIKHKSNIGKQAIPIQSSLMYLNFKNSSFFLKGKLGIFEISASELFFFELSKNNKTLTLFPKKKEYSFISSLWGTYRSIINNAIIGINLGFVQNLELVGLGFKASVDNSVLNFKIGKSHDVLFKLPKTLNLKFFTNTFMSLRGIDIQKVRHVAFQIYKLKKPDVYKNKGIRIPQITLLKKEGKKQK